MPRAGTCMRPLPAHPPANPSLLLHQSCSGGRNHAPLLAPAGCHTRRPSCCSVAAAAPPHAAQQRRRYVAAAAAGAQAQAAADADYDGSDPPGVGSLLEFERGQDYLVGRAIKQLAQGWQVEASRYEPGPGRGAT